MDAAIIAMVHHTVTHVVTVRAPAATKASSPSYLPAKTAAIAAVFTACGVPVIGLLGKIIDSRQNGRTDRTIDAYTKATETQTAELKQWFRDYLPGGMDKEDGPRHG